MPFEIETLLPHRPPMQWIESLDECTDTEAKATVRFSKDHFAVADMAVLESALVECVAQTVAAALGCRARQQGNAGKPGAGMLAAVSNFKIAKRPPLDAPLEIVVKEVKRLGPMLMVSGKITHQADLIASGELSLYA